MKAKVKSKSKLTSKKVVKKATMKVTKAKGHSKKTTKAAASSLIRTNVNMDKGLHAKAKQMAAKADISLNKLINTAIKEHLN